MSAGREGKDGRGEDGKELHVDGLVEEGWE